MQRFFIEALGRAQDLPALEEGFSKGLEEYARGELLPQLAAILEKAFSSIGACDSETFLHILIHELVHDNIEPAAHRVHVELGLSQAQEDALDETFAKLIELEVTRSIVPWAEEPLEQKREEAKWEGFLKFFEAMLCDWPGYIKGIEDYPGIEAFMKEEASKKKRELELARPRL